MENFFRFVSGFLGVLAVIVRSAVAASAVVVGGLLFFVQYEVYWADQQAEMQDTWLYAVFSMADKLGMGEAVAMSLYLAPALLGMLLVLVGVYLMRPHRR